MEGGGLATLRHDLLTNLFGVPCVSSGLCEVWFVQNLQLQSQLGVQKVCYESVTDTIATGVLEVALVSNAMEFSEELVHCFQGFVDSPLKHGFLVHT